MNDIDLRRMSYARVSDIIGIQTASEYKTIPIDVLANACIRGQKIDGYCTAFAQGLWISDIEEEYQPYFDEFKRWASENVEEFISSKVRLYDDLRRFTGEFDLIAVLKEGRKNALLDLKVTAKSSKAWGIQLSAYKHLCILNGIPVDTVFNLHLMKTDPPLYESINGEKTLAAPARVKAKVIPHDDDLSHYWDIFDSSLRCYDYFNRKEAI